jgi:branched-chain amino acid transport system permease protein
MAEVLLALLIGISYGMILFIIAVGLSLILGFMGIVELAHGAIFMISGYAGAAVAISTGNFALGILTACGTGGILGLLIERGLLRRFYGEPLLQILLTFACVYIIVNVAQWLFGAVPFRAQPFSFLSGSISLAGFKFPVYRFAVIFLGLAIFAVLCLVRAKMRAGAVLRAGMDDAKMVIGLGINLQSYITGAFAILSLLAGLAAIIAQPMLGGTHLEDAREMLYIALSVCILGGLGSIEGSLIAALILGIGISLVTIYVPALPMFIPYILMIIILLVRPSGLLGRKVLE